MIFLLTLSGILGMLFISWHSSAGRPAWQNSAAALIAATIVAVYASMFNPTEMKSIAADATNWLPGLSLVAGAATTAYFVLIARGEFALGDAAKNYRIGAAIWGAAAGVYLMFVAVDHWWFFRGDQSGVAASEALGVKDVPCGMALVREEGDAMAYRCPNLLVFKQLYADPFVPWPSYSSGTSTELKTKLDQLRQQAIQQ